MVDYSLTWTIRNIIIVFLLGAYVGHGIDEPSEVGDSEIVLGNGNSIGLSSLKHLCYAQCKAHCLETQAGTCEEKCSHFQMRDDWVISCKNNTQCLEKCSYLVNGSNTEKQPPVIPTVKLIQVASHWIALEWNPPPPERETTIYVVESADPGHRWQYLNHTREKVFTTQLDVCKKQNYRAAAVNQYGSNGYAPHSVVQRTDLPKPGPVILVGEPLIMFDSEDGYFYVILSWNIPIGWAHEDIKDYKLFDHMEKKCTPDNILPAVPFVNSISRVPRTTYIEAEIQIHRYGRGCTYYTTVSAVSNCPEGAVGAAVQVTIDLTDCDSALGLDCDDLPPVPPGRVRNVTVELLNTSLCVLTEWLPPEDLGSEGKVDWYDVQWGTHRKNSVTSVLEEAGRKRVHSNKTSIEICVNMTNVTYGVKVMPRVDEIRNRKFDMDRWSTDTEFCIDEMEFGGEKDSPTSSPTAPGERGKSKNPWQNMTIIGSVLSAALLVTTILFVQYKRMAISKRKNPSSDVLYKLNPKLGGAMKLPVTNPLYISSDPWEISRNRLVLGAALGRGAFGQVVLGELSFPRPLDPPPLPPSSNKYTVQKRSERSTVSEENYAIPNTPSTETVLKVAVKMLHDSADAVLAADFLQEIGLMKQIGAHPHIVSMLGCCTLADPLCLIVEHMPQGDLLHYLRNRRRNLTDTSLPEDEKLNVKDLLSFARQVAVGMEFLSQRGFVHRDLATRNVLVGAEKNVKIGDFGLTRYIYDDHIYVMQRGRTLPLKWMAIEAIFDLVFNTMTDVWSFGVVLYELITLGGVPYPTIPNSGLLRKLQSGYRMELPDNCPLQLYSLMLACWAEDPAKRPSFSDLRDSLEAMITDLSSAQYVTICVDESNPCYNNSLEDDEGVSSSSFSTIEMMRVKREAMAQRELRRSCSLPIGIMLEGLNEEESVTDDVFEQTGIDENQLKRHLAEIERPGTTWMSVSSGVFSNLPTPSPCPSSSSTAQLFFPNKREYPPEKGTGGQGHQRPPPVGRVPGRRTDPLRVSTCSEDTLLTNSTGGSIGSDNSSGILTSL